MSEFRSQNPLRRFIKHYVISIFRFAAERYSANYPVFFDFKFVTVVLLTKNKHGDIREEARVTNAIFHKNTATIKTVTPNTNFDLSFCCVV